MNKYLFWLKERIRLYRYLRNRVGRCEAVEFENGIKYRCGAKGGWGGCFGHTWPIKVAFEENGKYFEIEDGIKKELVHYSSPYIDGVKTEGIKEIKKQISDYLSKIK